MISISNVERDAAVYLCVVLLHVGKSLAVRKTAFGILVLGVPWHTAGTLGNTLLILATAVAGMDGLFILTLYM